VLNERSNTLAERTYTPRQDLEQAMRTTGLELFTWDSHRPVSQFDLIGVSLSTELNYTNFLTMLDLAGLPLLAADREPEHPLVLIGGHCATNPEPLASFIDGAVLGCGEQAVGVVSDLVLEWKQAGRPGGRAGLLRTLARRGKVYVPGLYDVTYCAETGQIESVTPEDREVPKRVAKWTLENLDDWPYPKAPLLPWAEAVHERVSVEVFRGCTRGCRFCQAGMITRPVRERDGQSITRQAESMLAATGYDEVSLLSLSSADHSQIGQIAKTMADQYQGRQIGLSLPSTRVDAFGVTLAQQLQRGGRRSGLTFAPEGGSERIRRVINKQVTEADLIETATTAFDQGWRHIKLYFMVGLPTETDEDVTQIARLAGQVIRAGREVTGQRDVSCTCSVGAFVPKSHTPFQWAPAAPVQVVEHRLRLLRETVASDRTTAKAIKIRWAAPRPAMLEGLLARGDRRVAAVVERAWRGGARFDGWRESLDMDLWEQCAEQVLEPQGLSLDWFTTRQRVWDEVLPWDHLDTGLDRDWLWNQWVAAIQGESQADCRWSGCHGCGVCFTGGVRTELASPGPRNSASTADAAGRAALAGGTDHQASGNAALAESAIMPAVPVKDAHVCGLRPASQSGSPDGTSSVSELADSDNSDPGGLEPAREVVNDSWQGASWERPQRRRLSDEQAYLFVRSPGSCCQVKRETQPAGIVDQSPGARGPRGGRRRRQPPPAAPAVATLVVHYAKRGRLRFASPRVIQRVFERAVRRAGLPMAYSSGFSPHPRLSYLSPAPTGTESEAEYLIVRLSKAMSADQVALALGQTMPPDLPILRVQELGSSDMASRLEASHWRIELPGVSHTDLAAAAATLLALDSAVITRPPRGDKPAIAREVRPGIVHLEVLDKADLPKKALLGNEYDVENPALGSPPGRKSSVPAGVPASPNPGRCGILDVVIRHSTPAVRPDDVIAALTEAAGLAVNALPRFTRLAQGLLRGNAGSIQDPLSRS